MNDPVKFNFKMGRCTGFIFKWLVPILVVLYGVYYYHLVANSCHYKSDVKLDGKTVIITGKPGRWVELGSAVNGS